MKDPFSMSASTKDSDKTKVWLIIACLQAQAPKNNKKDTLMQKNLQESWNGHTDCPQLII